MHAKYQHIPTSECEVDVEAGEERIKLPSLPLRLFSHLITLVSYTVFICLLPVTYWICIRKIRNTERIIIFRLGALIGSRGPGRVLVFPWIDRTQIVDVSNSAFSVPPQQLITHDGGIIEIGAEVQYAITDCVALVREVAEHQEMIRSLAKTVLIRLTIKRTVVELQKDKQSCEKAVMTEINSQVRKWGLDIRSVNFSDVKILKAPEKEGAGIPPLLASLGKREGLSPAEFAKYIYSMSDNKEKEDLDLQGLVESVEQGKTAWVNCLNSIVGDESFTQDNYGTYNLNLTDVNQTFIIKLDENGSSCKTQESDAEEPDVTIAMTSSDLAGILKGSLPPLQAYLANRITVTGDVRKLMLLEKLGNKSHKPGQTFSL